MKFIPKFRVPKIPAAGWKLAAELAGLVVGLCGVATWSVGAALTVGGALVIFAIERQ
jgi:hypothetical protein